MPGSCTPQESSLFTAPNSTLATVDGVSTAIRWALSFLGCHAPLCKKPAIVLDIDGTILINHADGSTKSVCHMTNFVKACLDSNISIFVVTARPDEARNRKWTERQLVSCGITPIEKLYMRPPAEDYGTCKHEAREEIRSNGHKILLSIGDQWGDVSSNDFEGLSDESTYIGTIGDQDSFAIKLPSEFI